MPGNLTDLTDANGNIASTTDGLNNTVTFEYDAANQRTKAIDPLLEEQLFAYGVRGEVRTITDDPSSMGVTPNAFIPPYYARALCGFGHNAAKELSHTPRQSIRLP